MRLDGGFDWDNARYFLATARAGQFLAAGRQLGVDHATVARRVAALEAQLGTSLFDRFRTGCQLTEAGERFLPVAERIEAEMLRAQSDLSRGDTEIAGTVSIGAPDGFGTLFLARRLPRLTARHSRLTIQLVPMPRVFSLSRREVDLAVTIDPPEEGRLAIRRLTDYTLRLYATRSYLDSHGRPGTIADLTQHTLVTYVPSLLFSPGLNFLPDVFTPTQRRIECASALGQSEAVRAGGGIGVLHDYDATSDPELSAVLPETVFRRSYWLVSHLDSRMTSRIRAVSDFIVQSVDEARSMFTPFDLP